MTSILEVSKHLTVLAFFLSLLLILGCASQKEETKQTFWQNWEELAKESKGHSPKIKTQTERLKKKESQAQPKQKTQEKKLPNDPVTLKMRNTDIRLILRAMAKAADQNLLITSKVKGKMSVNIEKKAWGNAFKSILKSQGLDYAWDGNIIRVMTIEEIKRNLELSRLQLKQKEQQIAQEQVAPLVTQTIKINFAELEEVQKNIQELIFPEKEKGKKRGRIVINKDTSSIMVQAVPEDIKLINKLVKKMDEPRKQINIKAKIIEATEGVAKKLGIQWGGIRGFDIGGGDSLMITPGGQATDSGSLGWEGNYDPSTGEQGISGQGFGVNAPVDEPAGSLGIIMGSVGGNILDMQLSALADDNKVNIISSPYITTMDNQNAIIKSGQKVPYVTIDEDGDTNVEFEDAVLLLSITPHIINQDYLRLDIHITKDDVDFSEAKSVMGNPTILKKETRTKLITKDDQTIVISGLTEEQNTVGSTGVPWLKDIPGLGWLFKGQNKSQDMNQLLIFITPDILPSPSVQQTERSQTN